MCGIVGILNLDYTTRPGLEKYFKEALYCDTLRGPDSTGIFAVPKKDEEVAVAKRALSAQYFMGTADAKSILKDLRPYKFVIGHNRWATAGEVNDQMAHPFKFGDITLVHNGTLDWWDNLPDGKTFESDSMAIANCMNVWGPKKTLENLQGDFALVWYDEKNDTLNFASNETRPLHFATIEGSSSGIIASEELMLRWLADRAKLELETVYSVSSGVMISIDLNTKEYSTMEYKPLPPLPYYQNYKSGWGFGDFDDYFVQKYGKGGSHSGSGATKSERYRKPPKVKGKRAKNLVLANVAQGEDIRFIASDFKYFPNSTVKGVLYGYMVGKSDVTVVCSPFFYDDYAYNKEYKGIVQYAAKALNSKGKPQVVVSNVIKVSTVVPFDTGSDTEFYDDDIPPLYTMVAGPGGTYVPKDEWEMLVGGGCSSCASPIPISEASEVIWSREGYPYCADCGNYMMANEKERLM